MITLDDYRINTDNYAFVWNEIPPYDDKIPNNIMCVVFARADNRICAKYQKEFKKQHTFIDIYNFIHRFMKMDAIREKYLIEGTNVKECFFSEDIVNPACRKKINQLNKTLLYKIQFSDLWNLYTYGTDMVSNMSTDEINTKLTHTEKQRIEKAFGNLSYQMEAKRWVVRGLKIEIAIKKVKVCHGFSNPRL